MPILRDLEAQLNFLLQTAAEGILVVDKSRRLVRLNPAAAVMLRLKRDEVLEQPAAEVFRHRADLLRLLSQPGEQQAEVALPHKRTATGVGTDLPGGGRIVLLHDVTERAALDSRREALVRAVAHDLRNPLNALLGYTDLVAKTGPLQAEQNKFLDRIRQTVQKLYGLAENLVDLAWIEAGMALQHQPFDLAHLIQQATDHLSEEAQQHRITIVTSIQDPIPSVMGDAPRIKQVLIYLLENALRYSYPDSNIAVHAWQDGPRVLCSVGDQGIGISEGDQEHIWDRLWRSSDPRVRDIPGGGIGLTFARAIVERHGGQIWVESTLNVGSTFTLMLPLTEGW